MTALALWMTGCAGIIALSPRGTGIDRSAIDASVRPQDDFFRHVNGAWLKASVIPPDRSRIGAGASLRERIDDELRGIVEDAVRRPADDDERRIGALYESFMDEAAVERAGLAPLATELAAIDAIASTTELARAMARLTTRRALADRRLDHLRQPRLDAFGGRAGPIGTPPSRSRLLPHRRRREVRCRARRLRRLSRATPRAVGGR